ncbi:MAG: PQQ-dependent sugar dehydrogenase [Actinomycetota bacterium]|nr:PQQ-dependent sugar dehydrogenase [Actinomycetota bacterium]
MRHALLPVALSLLASLMAAPLGAAEPTPQRLIDGLSFPTNMAFLPDGTLLFTEKETGAVRVVTPDGALRDRPFTTLAVMPDAERGLLGIAVHPDFEREPWVYLYYSDPADGLNRLVRVRADGVVAAGEPHTLLDGISAVAGYHNGGDLVFGVDGSLFVSLGEAHEPKRAQDERDIGGKVLRLTPGGDVPADGPFGSGSPVWSIGHRNSFGLCIDPVTGDLWETENGPDRDDEVNLIARGGNYGWPLVTGRAGDDRFLDPVVVFPAPIALTGCTVVDGDVWFGSFDGGVWRLPAVGDEPIEVATFSAGVTDVALGANGLVYVATSDSIWTVQPQTVGATSSQPASSSPVGPREPAGSPITADEAGGGWRPWIVSAALVVLAGALGARFVAGRRLRARRKDPPPGQAGF